MENKVFVIKTFQDNEVPTSFDGAKIYIVGQDIVIKTRDGDIYEYPFAAQFLSMSKDVFHLKFADGKSISSKELINYVEKNEFDIDGSLNKNQAKEQKAANSENQDDSADDAQSDVTPDEPAPPKVITKIVKVQEVIVKEQDATNETSTASNDKFEAPISDFTGYGDYSTEPMPEKPIVISSSGLPPKNENESIIIIPPKEQIATSKQFDMNTYQSGDIRNNQDHTITIGGSRTDGSFEAQYENTTLDLSSSTQSWTVDAELNGWNYDNGSVTRVIAVDNVDVLTEVKFRAEMSDDYKIIKAGTPEGNALNLKPNEFAVVYPSKDNSFSVDIEFNSATGEALGEKKGILDFVVSSDPDKITNESGSVNLGYTPTPLVVKLGQGDDVLKAGIGEDIYDGGRGHNTLDYSHAKTHIEVDLTQDVTQAFDKIGVTVNDAGSVNLGNGKTQNINNFETIIGSNHGDTFILNNKGHTIKGGTGDDTYVMNGGSNTLVGNAGNNTLDYHKAGMDTAYDHMTLAGSGHTLDINGVTIDLTQGKTTHNGVDSGQDSFTGINHIVGSAKNDHIILGDSATKVTEKVGDNYIQAGNGQYEIDGGAGNSLVDYAKLNEKITVNLNTGKVEKGQTQDSLINIHHVVGSEGGTDFIGKTGGENTLVGVSGENSFNVKNGSNQLYGGDQTNSYLLDTGVSTIHANGHTNTAVVNNSILRYNGSSGTGANDRHSDFINTLDYTGGIVDYIAGEGKSTNHITSHNGGTISLQSKGETTFVSENGGTNTVHLAEGTLDFLAKNGGDNTLTTAADTHLTLHGGKASHSIMLAKDSTMDLDYYSNDLDSRHKAVINLDASRNVNIDDGTYIDLIRGEGMVSNIAGLKGGNTEITLSQTRQEDMDISLSNENNIVKVGKGLANITVDNTSQTNHIDYRNVDAQLHFDLSADKGNLVRDGQSQENLKNVSYITGNDHNGNVYKATDKFDVIFETGAGTGNRIIEIQGNHTYKTQGHELSIDGSELTTGMQFEYDGIHGAINKGDTISTITGNDTADTNAVTKVTGSQGDDTFTLNFGTDTLASQTEFTVVTGSGNNTVNLNHQGYFTINPESAGQTKPAAAHNTLNIVYQNVEDSTDIIRLGDNGQSGSLSSKNNLTGQDITGQKTDFNYIDKINYQGDNELQVNWGNKAQGANITVDNGEHNTYLHVNGGGNTIEGGLKGHSDKTVLVSYQENTTSGIEYDATQGNTVSFTDGRTGDNISDFNVLQGSKQDDTIVLKEGMTLLSSQGDDTLTGNGATYQAADELSTINADFLAGNIAKRENNTLVGTDKLEGDGFSQFVNGNNMVYANIQSSDSHDMEFDLVGGTVDFHSHADVNNQINTDDANLILHYESFNDRIQLNMGSEGKNQTIKGSVGSEKIDSFTHAQEIKGSNHGDKFTFKGNINEGNKLTIQGGTGIDEYHFNGTSTSSLEINAGKNTNLSGSETFNFNGKNSNIKVTTSNANNIFNFTDTSLSNTDIAINSIGGNALLFNNVNQTDSTGQNNIHVESSSNRTNVLDFQGVNKNLNIDLVGGNNKIDFRDSNNSDMTISANSSSDNTLSIKDSMMGKVTYYSESGHDVVVLENVNKDAISSNKFIINTDKGENLGTAGSGNSFTVSGENKNITINTGEKDDVFDFSHSVSNDNLSITSLGGNNTFKMTGALINSRIESKGSGNDTYSFDGVNVNSGSAANKLNVIEHNGNNTFDFSGENHWIDITGGYGDDIFNFYAGNNSNVNIKGLSGTNQYNIYDINSMPTRIDGGNEVDIFTFKGQEVNDKEMFYYINNQTTQIDKFEFNALDDGQKIVLDFSEITERYGNDTNTINIEVGNKNNVEFRNEDGWTRIENADSDIFSYSGLGEVHVSYSENSQGDSMH